VVFSPIRVAKSHICSAAAQISAAASHGTEAMGICWRHLEWYTDKGVRYLPIWVDGKTGGRWLIAKHRAVEVLKRLHARQRDICDLSFKTTMIYK
jgi:hypothetical protein